MPVAAAVFSILGFLTSLTCLVLLLAQRGRHDGLHEWVAEGYALAESSAFRAMKENKTTHLASDKRQTALGWVRSRAEAAGMPWDAGLEGEAARLLEIHHGRLHVGATMALHKTV